MSVEPRTATVMIFQGDYLDRIRLLEAKAEAAAEAESATPKRGGSKSEAQQLAEEHDALVREAEESALRVVVRALRRSEWKALVAKHPPRPDHKGDEFAGVNEDTFMDDLVPASIVEPVEFSADDLDALSDRDFERLYLTAFALNRGAVATPKASLASRLTRTSDET